MNTHSPSNPELAAPANADGVSDATAVPTLEAFASAARAAGDDGEVRVRLDGQTYLVLAAGRTPSGRDVSWVTSTEPDAAAIYLAVLKKHFGPRLAGAVADHFPTDLRPGTPLRARVVTEAMHMADRSLTAFSGVDFLSRLQGSALARGPQFDAACRRHGIDGAALPVETRAAIDRALQQRFQLAMVNGESPVPAARVQQWLEEILTAQRSGATDPDSPAAQ